ncbi:MAG: tetratricopeptide repeat protein [Planctomycetota bacterium]
MTRNSYWISKVIYIATLLSPLPLILFNAQVAVSEDAKAQTPEEIYTEAESLFEAQNYEQALQLYNKLMDKKYATTKFVKDNKDDIGTRIKFCEKKLGVVSDICSLFNGKAVKTKKGKDEWFSVSYDFSKDNQVEDFTPEAGLTMSVKDGKLVFSTKYPYYFDVVLKNVAFANTVSIEFEMKITSDESDEIYVVLFRDSGSGNGYNYMFNYKSTSMELTSNVIYLPSGKRGGGAPLIGSQDCLGSFPKPKIESGKSYKVKISLKDGVHQVYVDNALQKEVKNNKLTFGQVALGCSKTVVTFDNLKIEGMLDAESVRKSMVGATSQKQTKQSEEEDNQAILARIKQEYEKRSPKNLFKLDRLDELLDKNLPEAQEAVKKGIDMVLNVPYETMYTYEDLYAFIEKVLEKFNEAIKYDPKCVVAYFLRSKCFQLMSDLDQGVKELTSAIDIDPAFYECYVDRGELYLYGRQFENALKDLNKALDIKSDYAEAYAQRGYAFFAMGERTKAMADIEKALSISPSNSTANEYDKNLKHIIKGPAWQKVFTKETKYFIFKTDISQAKCDLYAKHLETIIKHILKTFSLKEDPLLVNKAEALIFDSQQSYFDFADLSSGGAENTLGYYHPIYKQLFLFEPPQKEKQTMRVMYHETFHMVIDRYIQDMPIWLNEGMAEYIGGTDIDGATMATGQIQERRLDNLLRAFDYDSVFPFKQIMNESKTKFYSESIGYKYAQAWSMIHFFINFRSGEYFKQLKDYYMTLLGGKSAKAAYDKTFAKMDLKQVQKEWKEYVNKLKK